MRKVVWDLVAACELVRDLNHSLKHIGWGIGIVGSVLTKGYSTNDLDLVVFPHDASGPSFVKVLYMALESEGMKRKHTEEQVHAAWRKLKSEDTKHVEVWLTKEGKRVDLFILS